MSFADTKPKLSFRQNPLRLPVIKKKPIFTFSLDVEKQELKPAKRGRLKQEETHNVQKQTVHMPTTKYIFRIFFFWHSVYICL